LDVKSPYHKKTFSELDNRSRRKLEGSVLRAFNIRQLGPDDGNTSIYHIFERLNTGGTPLKQQEIRNCVFRGEFVSVLKQLNENNNWRLILGKPDLDKHQRDVELLLRIFSLSQKDGGYEKPMKEFLNKCMSKHRCGDTPQVIKFKETFPVATELIVKKLGVKPFHLRGPLNAAALDSVFCTIINNLENLSPSLSDKYAQLKENGVFDNATLYSTSDAKVVKERFGLALNYLLNT